jgi:hypothetical protein
VERRVTPILSVSAGCIAVGVVLALSPPALQVGELPVKPAPIHETVIYPTVPIRIVKTASALQPPPVVKVRPEVPPVWKPVALPPVPAKLPADETAAIPKSRPAVGPGLVRSHLSRYCARPGKTERSWIRVRGRKLFCPA